MVASARGTEPRRMQPPSRDARLHRRRRVLLGGLVLAGAREHEALLPDGFPVEHETIRAFAEDRNTKDARHWRIVNEVPTVLMIAIVILVIVKPW